MADGNPSTTTPPPPVPPPPVPPTKTETVVKVQEQTTTTVAKVGGVQTVHIDGALWVQIGVLTFLEEALNADSAKTAFATHALTLWIVQVLIGAWLAGATALKMFRSTTFAKSKNGDL